MPVLQNTAKVKVLRHMLVALIVIQYSVCSNYDLTLTGLFYAAVTGSDMCQNKPQPINVSFMYCIVLVCYAQLTSTHGILPEKLAAV